MIDRSYLCCFSITIIIMFIWTYRLDRSHDLLFILMETEPIYLLSPEGKIYVHIYLYILA